MTNDQGTRHAASAAWSRQAVRALSEDTGSPAARRADGTQVTAGEILADTRRSIAFLDALGCLPGRPVPALVSTSPQTLSLLLAGALTGRPVAPIGPRLTPAETAKCLGNLESDVVIAPLEYAETAAEAATLTGRRYEPLGAIAQQTDDRALPAAGPGGTIAILHTSGTTGAPKPVPLTDSQMAARSTLLTDLMRLDRDSVLVAGSPFHHIAGLGMVFVALATGATTAEFPSFSVERWLEVGSAGMTHAALVATHVEMIVAAGAWAAPNLEFISYGASVLRPETLSTLLRSRPDIALVRWYGQTEGSPLTWLSPDDHRLASDDRPQLFDTVGHPVPGLELRIDNPVGKVGEILARAAHLALADADGWRRTGDLGWIDDEGRLVLQGRSGDMIIRGGENVYPVEVERVLAQVDGVAACVVVGVPDAVLGQRILAYIEPHDRAHPPSEEVLRSHLRRELAGFKVPAEWVFVDTFERNASGKIIRPRAVP